MVEDVSRRQITDQGLVDWCLLEVELVDFLGERQPGNSRSSAQIAAGLESVAPHRRTLADLGGEQVTDHLRRFVLPLHHCGHDLVVSRLDTVELELARRTKGGSPEAVISRAVCGGFAGQAQRRPRRDRQRRCRLAVAGEDAQDDAGRMSPGASHAAKAITKR